LNIPCQRTSALLSSLPTAPSNAPDFPTCHRSLPLTSSFERLAEPNGVDRQLVSTLSGAGEQPKRKEKTDLERTSGVVEVR
jgi:hypothetical protein